MSSTPLAPMPTATLDMPRLLQALNEKREAAGLRWYQVAEQSGVKAVALSRIVYGKGTKTPCALNLLKLLLWIGEPNVDTYLQQPDTDSTQF